MQAAVRRIRNTVWVDRVSKEGDERNVGEPKIWAVLDYNSLESPNVSGEVNWQIQQDATIRTARRVRVYSKRAMADLIAASCLR